MATNEILPFSGTDTGTNLLTQAEYLADAQRPTGNQSGIARSKLINKVLKQTSLISAAVAKFMADNQANNVVDTATVDNLALWLEAGVKASALLGSEYVGGAFKKLKVTSTGTNSSVTITADQIVVEGTYSKRLSAVSLTVAGSSVGANGLDTGALAINTWYSVWVIWNGTTTAGLLSLSETAPTLPAGYTHKARVGWVRTDGTGNKYPLPFVQYGRVVEYVPTTASNLTGHRTLTSGAAVGSTSLVNYVPPTAGVARILAQSFGGANVVILIGSSTLGDPAHVYAFGIASTASVNTNPVSVAISQNPRAIYVNGQSSTSTFVYGWEDNL